MKGFLSTISALFKHDNHSVTKEEELSTFVSADKLEDAEVDERGVLYSKDKKWVIRAPRSIKSKYELQEGAVILCDEAFYWCGSISSITLPEGVIAIGDGAFSCCQSVSDISLPNSLKLIGDRAFCYDYRLKFEKLPPNVRIIGDSAFVGCNFSNSLTLPQSITRLGENPFGGSFGLKKIKIEDGNKYYSSDDGILYNKDKTELVCYPTEHSGSTLTVIPSVISIQNGAFNGCKNLKKVILPENLRHIGDEAFYGMTSLGSITIPNRVSSIHWGTFMNCTSLTSVTLPEGIRSIEDSAFYGCTSLFSINLPKSLERIGDEAFRGCKFSEALKDEIESRCGNSAVF